MFCGLSQVAGSIARKTKSIFSVVQEDGGVFGHEIQLHDGKDGLDGAAPLDAIGPMPMGMQSRM